MNQVSMRDPRALLMELIAAAEALAPAVRTADALARDGDVRALDMLERIAERLGGAQRHANEARAALQRERETSR
jgi:hypothetical protein